MQQYAHEQRHEWLAWFVDPATSDEGELRRALLSVPDVSWPSIQRTLDDRLSGLSPMEHGDAERAQAANFPRVVFPSPVRGSGGPALPGGAGSVQTPSYVKQELTDSVTFFLKRHLVSLEGTLRGSA